MKDDELREYFVLQMKLRELCDQAGIARPLSKREMQIGVLALACEPPTKPSAIQDMDLGLTL